MPGTFVRGLPAGFRALQPNPISRPRGHVTGGPARFCAQGGLLLGQAFRRFEVAVDRHRVALRTRNARIDAENTQAASIFRPMREVARGGSSAVSPGPCRRCGTRGGRSQRRARKGAEPDRGAAGERDRLAARRSWVPWKRLGSGKQAANASRACAYWSTIAAPPLAMSMSLLIV
jgi:hypothetical protein